MIEKRLRENYTGEFVITNTIFKAGRKEQTREWIDNPIINTSINHRACCITNGPSIQTFPMKRLQEHRGGLLSRFKMQLYGTEDIWESMTPDFLVVLEQARLDDLIAANYNIDNIVYTSASLCIKNPAEFFLIPHGVMFSSAAIAVWLACFDGHKDIYLFGYDIHDANNNEQFKMIHSVTELMSVYSDISFHHVSNVISPDEWRQCINFNRISRDTFVSECDI